MWTFQPLLFLHLLVLFPSALPMAVLEKPGESRVCDGTSFHLSSNENHSHHIRGLRQRYENCTYVQGNLEINNILADDDLRFLSQIREVTGYVLIAQIQKDVIPLPNLRVIRGRTLYSNSNREYSLWVAANPGLREVGLWSLQEIMRGNVLFADNHNLCHVNDTVDWYDILANNRTQTVSVENSLDIKVASKCLPCSHDCSGFCWGGSPSACQKLSKSFCASQCHPGRCYGKGARDCCHSECVGGCLGPGANQCLACRAFDHDGVCVQDCPQGRYYDQGSMMWKRKSNPKLAYGNTCVDKCPLNMLQDDGACVRECPEGKISENGACVPCNGPCPKICRGFSKDRIHGVNFITDTTIQSFINCTIIEGDLLILSQTFMGVMEFPPNASMGQRWHDRVSPADLEQLSTIREISGYVRVDGSHPDMTDLSFLRNLEVIYGRTLEEKFALTISKSTSLTSLALNSLKKIAGGGVRILENRELCFADTVAFNNNNMTLPTVPVLVRNNRPKEQCKEDGQVCHSECSSDGCWGKNSTQCVSCAHAKFQRSCIASCDALPNLFDAGNQICEACHAQCVGGCRGPSAENCTRCLNAKDGLVCKPSCPLSKYKDEHGVCQLCNRLCSTQGDESKQGCTGSGSFVGEGGCRSCDVGVYTHDGVVRVQCQESNKCPLRHYTQRPGFAEAADLRVEAMIGKVLCRACDPLCTKCQGEGVHCGECLHFKEDDKCVSNCSFGTHYQKGKRCLPCSSECSPKWGCSGPNATQCVKCKNSRDYFDKENHPDVFNCTTTCPEERKFTVRTGHESYLDATESLCTVEDIAAREEEALKRKRITLGCSIGLGIPIVGIIIYVYLAVQKAIAEKNSLKIMAKFANIEETDPFTPTDIKPNTAKLRIFSEKELRRGRLLGQGAFGYVYQGLLVPATENKRIPVAIKELKEGLGAAANQDVMEEARVMASVRNAYLVPLIGICMTTPTILITQLLPLGCLLDYVKDNRNQIRSTNFLTWCSQIARGMKYLEDRHMLHRDLAARNVLVQTPKWVKVTDFGLAKMLDDRESTYKAGNGRMPVKWLAPECIEQSIYSHKTDVWAFGVTVWEILTYGDKPYDTIPAKNLLEKLQSGERLAHPAICSLDVYMLMLKCWSPHPESRPSFTDLASEFGKMVRDPGRYLTIVGDDQLRLPDFTQEDEQRIWREFGDNGNEEFVTAEQYINPGAYSFDPSIMGTMKKHGYQNGHIQNGKDPHNWRPEHSSLPVFVNVSAPFNDSRNAWSVDRKDSPPHSRYAMDPVKGAGKYGEPIHGAGVRKSSRAVLIGPDDYLIPTENSPMLEEPYLDLRDKDAELLNDYQKMPLMSGRRPSAASRGYPTLPNGGPVLFNGGPALNKGPALLNGGPALIGPGRLIPGAPLVNNPEYHLFSSGASSASTESAPSQTREAPHALEEFDDNSDHEHHDYGYGMRDRHRSETIPLNQPPRRNETTV